MKHRRFAGSEADRHHHVAELRKRGVGEDAFDVVLLRRHQGGEHGGDRPDPGDHEERIRRSVDQKTDAHEHVNARRHHRRRMDQSRDGRRTFHRVGQPNVKRKLRRLSDRAAENKERRGGQITGVPAKARHSLRDIAENKRAGRAPDHENAEHESEVAKAIGDERFLRRLHRSRPFKPMPDEQIRADPDQLPKDEHHDEVVRQNDPEHGEHEERERREVARLARVRAHVA